MNYMFKDGFFPTNAPLFMDEVMFLVALLPFLLIFSINFAKKGKISLHKKSQILIYILGLLTIIYFEYGARTIGGFAPILQKSHLNHYFLYGFLIIHILIATISLFLWTYTLYFSLKNSQKSYFIKAHLKLVKPTFLLITLTSVTGLLLYFFMYVL